MNNKIKISFKIKLLSQKINYNKNKINVNKQFNKT